jgi:hypothetical protein
MQARPATSLERHRFGAVRTLNLHAGKFTRAEAAARVEAWLRAKQVELSGDVLVITGRGAHSLGGIPVLKNATQRVLSRLRRLGVVESFGEENAGSFVVGLAPLRSLMEAPARKRSPIPAPGRAEPPIHGLTADTLERLRELASRAIEALGVKKATEGQVTREMLRQFGVLVRAAPAGTAVDSWVAAAVLRALRDYEDSDR